MRFVLAALFVMLRWTNILCLNLDFLFFFLLYHTQHFSIDQLSKNSQFIKVGSFSLSSLLFPTNTIRRPCEICFSKNKNQQRLVSYKKYNDDETALICGVCVCKK